MGQGRSAMLGRLTGRPCFVAGQVAGALAARGWTGAPRRCGRSCGLAGTAGRAWQAGRVIVGIGVDMVDIARLGGAAAAPRRSRTRLFAEGERGGRPASLAACFAAKEAVAKALGAPAGLRWADVRCGMTRRAALRCWSRGTVADAAGRLGVRRWHVSLSHDGGVSVACVVAEA